MPLSTSNKGKFDFNLEVLISLDSSKNNIQNIVLKNIEKPFSIPVKIKEKIKENKKEVIIIPSETKKQKDKYILILMFIITLVLIIKVLQLIFKN